MNYIELGKEHSKVCILFHGGGLSTWQYKEAAELLKEDYHVILPIIDGHDGESFISIEESAKEWISFIKEKLNGQVEILGGCSLGGQIAIEMASIEKDICKILYLESVALIKDSLTAKLVPMSFKMAYPLIQQKWFSKLQFKSLKMKASYFEDYYKTTSAIKCDDLIKFTKASCLYTLNEKIKESNAQILYVYGSLEVKRILNSATLLNQYKKTFIQEIKGLAHGELSLNHSAKFVQILAEFMKDY